MKTIIGQVTTSECKEIRSLHERKNSLLELAKVITDNDVLYEKLIKDMSLTNSKFDKWWRTMDEKYHWDSKENAHWEIDFETCNIYLIDE